MSKNDELVDEAKKAIDRVFSDQSVDVPTALRNLDSLIFHIEILKDSLNEV